MDYIADLHIHSKYAGACSDQLILENLDRVAKIKGIQIIGTGDFTHPLWSKDLKGRLEETEGSGLYRLKGSNTGTRFMLTSEVSLFFGNGDAGSRVKKIHNLIFAPSLEVVDQINDRLGKYGNLASDGRPILQLSNSDLVEMLYKADPRIMVMPSHVWTPWFGVLGAMSGFNSLEEAYGDQVKHIYALEMGLSSDPLMNWRISKLDKFTLLAGSDAHSLPKIGREAIVFGFDDEKVSYGSITDAIKEKRIKMTLKFYPEEGKYHFDGHRACNVSLSPEDAKKYGNICPRCRKQLTIGVLHRVESLADRKEGERSATAKPFVHIIQLQDIIAYVTKKGVGTSSVSRLYDAFIKEFGTEFNVLLNADITKISEIEPEVGRAIENVRNGRVRITPGYDGVFGVIDILDQMPEQSKRGNQKRISEF
jgi:uncharacterized protein (TIGR00375 family)